ncbi:MAG: T9SS type A sorting domain-containing protein [Bacteroidia bacterium]|nr:T9SS type A sorting domain-containing protein [Bacteroidia bacterium]
MKKLILSTCCLLAIVTSNAQSITDTVSIGAGYTNQKWYSLDNDEQGSAPKNNWDIAFEVSGYGTSIHINSIIGTMLWTYPTSDTAGWSTFDTTGLYTWAPQYNSDTSWTLGAFDKNAVPTNPNDVGWGIYNPVTHIITGDSLFVIKLANGSYKKLWIQDISGGAYNFKYADLNGTNQQNVSIVRAAYNGKNFAYYSLQTNSALDREPLAANWDLIFTQYTAFIPSPYTVAGVLSNKGVKTAQVNNVPDVNTYTNWQAHSLNTPINEIGYDWKVFTGVWEISDSLVYFVKSKPGDLWKLVFTGFGGSGNGNYIFKKEKLSTVSIEDVTTKYAASLTIYPNPATGEKFNILFDIINGSSTSNFIIYDLLGKIIYSKQLNNTEGINNLEISTHEMEAGVYIVCMYNGQEKIQQKLIIK